MEFSAKQMAFAVATLGVLSFVFGILAETHKPPAGEPIKGNCKYPSDPSVPFGYLSIVFLVASSAVGYFSLFYPYKGKSVPTSVFLDSFLFTGFLSVAVLTAAFAVSMLLWTTINEHYLLTHTARETCPTAKTGVFGGGAFGSLDSSLFWLIALMLGTNVREDYFDEAKGGDYSEALTIE
ncbi:hypothetical protein U1Q18_036357 [Sarracenia purpurea var. burkii]